MHNFRRQWHFHQPGNLFKHIVFESVCLKTIKVLLSCAREVIECIQRKFSLRLIFFEISVIYINSGICFKMIFSKM